MEELFQPINWLELSETNYGRSEMAVEFFDQEIFGGSTFADIRYPDSPFILINSSDLSTGAQISFAPPVFASLCLDLDSYSVSRAIVASSAVPGLATPIELKSYAGTCNAPHTEWLFNDIEQDEAPLQDELLSSVDNYQNSQLNPYLHLVDGGVTDNLGLRPFLNAFGTSSSHRRALQSLGHDNIRQILIISVNASTFELPGWSTQAGPPGMLESLRAVETIQMHHYNVDTLLLMRHTQRELATSLSNPGRPVTVDFVDVSFRKVQDQTERDELNRIPTSFQLENSSVDQVIAAGRLVLSNSAEFRHFVLRNDGQVSSQLSAGQID